MRIAIIGSIYGGITPIYEKCLKNNVEWVLSTGNFGIWPDPIRASRQARLHGAGEFLDYFVGKKHIAIPTLMVGGKHEDHWWIKQMLNRGDAELIENLHFLANGNKTFIDNINDSIHILGLGGTYSVKPEANKGQYSQKEVLKACAAGPIDILLCHEGPDGERFGDITSTAKGINKICFATRPRLLVHGKYNQRKFYNTVQTGTKAICVGTGESIILDINKDMVKLVC